jgi:hypothetical protein
MTWAGIICEEIKPKRAGKSAKVDLNADPFI